MRPLAIIPARTGSIGIPEKNTRLLAGRSPVERAATCAREAGCRVLVTSDAPVGVQKTWCAADIYHTSNVHSDTSAMIDVVKAVLAVTHEEAYLLVQPTQPLREPRHLIQAIRYLYLRPRPDSVVSIVEVPIKYHPAWQIRKADDRWQRVLGVGPSFPPNRQLLGKTYIRDGTVYAFWRLTVERYGNIYGRSGRPLIIPPEETCALDTLVDWDEAERRLNLRSTP